ncbi:MAG: sugar ABC transporter permease [Nitrososphaerota archaeon]
MGQDRIKFFFILPAVIYILALVIFPLATALYTSLTDARFGGTLANFVGIRNYMMPFGDYRFYNSVYVTLLFVVLAVPIELALGLLLALLVSRNIKGQGIIRSLLIIPLFVSPIAFALMGQVIFYEGGGGINGILRDLGLPTLRWRSDPTTAIFTVVLADVWMWTPFAFLITLAGLNALPKDIVEAARIDGASDAQMFRHVTLPLLTPTLLTILFFRIIDTLRLFEIPFTLLGGGGPGITTETLTVYIYKIGFRGFFFGQAAAVSFIYLVMVSAILSVLLYKVRKYYV